ncbi:uncharacterized protein BO97DRAFT_38855 [Aspergillus homomorphus CBS 101889]|uniref:Uncharacterized protein n=1 Tax=Aspergillus homomorphus (strain CBS 101889) TaxID=1450537 RepID=A0A395I179_ASPHC|nr:hypothetical protein BO97DRAFT_38855 [Aspergillus homomorphus CBS 101889]RAL13439.1 hypothetical protein BO97DRAFT_38855 [Aspergillus homomorphus CBS 101889]
MQTRQQARFFRAKTLSLIPGRFIEYVVKLGGVCVCCVVLLLSRSRFITRSFSRRGLLLDTAALRSPLHFVYRSPASGCSLPRRISRVLVVLIVNRIVGDVYSARSRVSRIDRTRTFVAD